MQDHEGNSIHEVRNKSSRRCTFYKFMYTIYRLRGTKSSMGLDERLSQTTERKSSEH